jgi:colicin import membrane protein
VNKTSIAIALLLAAAGAGAQTIGATAQAFPRGSIASIERAGEAERAAESEHAAIEARYTAAERVCYGRFFVNACLNQADEARRAALALLRPVELEAGRFRRLSAAQERDKLIAEREQEYAAAV